MDVPHRSSTLAGIRRSRGRVRQVGDHAQAVDQPIRRPAYVDSGLQNSTFRESVSVGDWTGRPSDYGSEGWGFESLRARNIIRRVTSGNAGRAPFKVRPLWTPGALGRSSVPE